MLLCVCVCVESPLPVGIYLKLCEYIRVDLLDVLFVA